MKVIIVEPLKAPYVKDIDPSLESMQKIVGGTIQAIYPFDDPEIALICNDDGKLLHLFPNRGLFDEEGYLCDIICGTFFLCAAPSGAENFAGLSEKQIRTYKKRFKRLELHLG